MQSTRYLCNKPTLSQKQVWYKIRSIQRDTMQQQRVAETTRHHAGFLITNHKLLTWQSSSTVLKQGHWDCWQGKPISKITWQVYFATKVPQEKWSCNFLIIWLLKCPHGCSSSVVTHSTVTNFSFYMPKTIILSWHSFWVVLRLYWEWGRGMEKKHNVPDACIQHDHSQ